MTEKEMMSKYCPLAQGTCKVSMCAAWNKTEPGVGDCLIMTYYNLLTTPTSVTTVPTREG